MHFHIITLFPEVCRAYTDASVIGRAQKVEKGKGAKVRGRKLQVSYYDPRDFADNKHKRVDDRPYGGGPGMVMQVGPVVAAWQQAVGRKRKGVRTLVMSPRGRQFDQAMAKELAESAAHIVLISGRYEGIDARVTEITQAEEVSVGDYVLSGGELPALTILDATARHIPGVLGDSDSIEDERVTSGVTYTRPPVFIHKGKSYPVPEVLLGGDHARIEAWRATVEDNAVEPK